MALTPFYSNFVTYEKCEIKIKGLSHENMVTVRGKLYWHMKDDFVHYITVENCSYPGLVPEYTVHKGTTTFYSNLSHYYRRLGVIWYYVGADQGPGDDV